MTLYGNNKLEKDSTNKESCYLSLSFPLKCSILTILPWEFLKSNLWHSFLPFFWPSFRKIIYISSVGCMFKLSRTFVSCDFPLKYHLIDDCLVGWGWGWEGWKILWKKPFWVRARHLRRGNLLRNTRFYCWQGKVLFRRLIWDGFSPLQPRPISNHARKSLPKTSLESNKFNLSGLARLGVRLIHLQFQSKQTKCILSSSRHLALAYPMKMQCKLCGKLSTALLESFVCSFESLLQALIQYFYD